MIVTAKELRFNVSLLFDALEKGEEILITYRGKARAKLTPYNAPNEPKNKDDEIFGMWKDQDDDVNTLVRKMRQGRNFAS